jgi:hypothetical protein
MNLTEGKLTAHMFLRNRHRARPMGNFRTLDFRLDLLCDPMTDQW